MRTPTTMMFRLPAIAAVFFAAAGSLASQVIEPLVPAPPALLNAFEVSAANVQNLVVPPTAGRSFQVRVVLDGNQQILNLVPYDVRSRDFQLLVDDGTQVRQVPTPPSVTYRGTVGGVDGSSIAASLYDGQLRALVEFDGETWEISPANEGIPGLPHSAYIVFRASDIVGTGTCATPNGSPIPPTLRATHGQVTPDSVRKEVEIAIDCDFNFYQRRGSSVTTAQADATTVINAVDRMYQRDIDLQFKITTIIVRTTSTYSSTTTALLGQVQARWLNQHGSVKRDLQQLFSGKNNPGQTLGIANLGCVCQKSCSSVVWTLSTGGLQSRGNLSAHEIGHQFGAGHCNSQSPCYNMCSTLGGCNGSAWKFSPTSINRITTTKNNRQCIKLPAATTPAQLTNVNPGNVMSYQPAQVTLTGVDLDTVTSVTVGGTPLAAFTAVDPTTITFQIPSPFEIATHDVVAINPAGSSNPVSLTVDGLHPSLLQAPIVHSSGQTVPYPVWTDRNHIVALFGSTSALPSSFPGLVNLAIGNNFTELFQLSQLNASTGGFAQINLYMPMSLPTFTLFLQCITVDPTSPTLPFEVSNAATVIVL